MSLRYVLQALRRRAAETGAVAVAIGLTVAFLACVGSFTTQTGSRLSVRAAARVPVDWQVQLTAAADATAVARALAAVPGVTGARPVAYARVRGLSVTTAGRTRTTGTAVVVALPSDYATFAPGQVRLLVGSAHGVVLQQQTASNLAAVPGAPVRVVGAGRAASFRVSGVVDLPHADSFFQVVGASPGGGASAPPDNVVLVPPALFGRLTAGVPSVRQFHVRFAHASLPADPAAALNEVSGRANHFLSVVPGAALLGDNLGASLSAAREDALYARLLVLLLAVPGVVLAGFVTSLVVSLRNDRQRRDLALLRLRGATPARTLGLLGGTALGDGLVGAGLGAGGAVVATRLAFGRAVHVDASWVLISAALGVLLALLVEVAPVLRAVLRKGQDQTGFEAGDPERLPWALRAGLDGLLLALAGLVFWLTARGGYRVVVVPEGIPVASVNYAALLAPALAWPGLALLVWRLTMLGLARRPRAPRMDPHGRMIDLRRQSVRRRRRVIARGAAGLAVAVGVVVSAAVFTSTYDRQAHLDTALTVGSDVAVTLPADSPISLDRKLTGGLKVQAVEQVSHRLVYVGPDLQDLYAVDAATVGRAAPLQDAFTPGHSVRAVLRSLASVPDGVLLSQETLHDYQLRVGDSVRLRLKAARGDYRTFAFHVVGVVSEFATAPRDSFVVANRDYVARVTGRSAVQTLLIRTTQPREVAAGLHPPASALVNDVSAPRVDVPSASGLAAGSLAGLSRLILGFGLLLAVASASLVVAVGAAQRRRALVALGVLGATPRQRSSFVWSEARALVGAGLLGGFVAGIVVGFALVKVLTGIFDPPPTHPALPLLWTGSLLVMVLAASGAVTAGSARWAGRLDAARLRDL